MKILLDTNILIQRENYSILPSNIAKLLQIIEKLNYPKCIHQLSIDEIKKDGKEERREVNLSKLSSYPVLEEYPNYLEDCNFVALLPEPKNDNDKVDNQLLYCVAKSVVSHLITEDQELLKKAENIGLQTVYSVNEALNIFNEYLPKSDIKLTSTFKKVKSHEININDNIFTSLKKSYKDFDNWWKNKVVEEDRTIYLYQDDFTKQINAILIPKIEKEIINCNPSIPIDKYVKICMFKVSENARGLKLGEQLINMAIEYAIINNVDKLYLTHYREENDYLIRLIEEYGFVYRGNNTDGEEIYTKEIVVPQDITNKYSDSNIINRIYYPSFCDGENVNKFIVPIQPQYHKMLFPEYKHPETNIFKQLFLFKLPENIKSHGYGIKKAYLANSFVSKMKQGDIILLYRSEDYQAITTAGIIEFISCGNRDSEVVKNLTAKRTVFSDKDIAKMCEKDTTVILFKKCFHLQNEFKYEDMLKQKIILGPIIKMQEISDDNYRKIIKGNIDECFTIH